MSVLISGVLMNPAGVPVSGAEVTFSALTNGPSVLNGFSASVMTDQDGNYAIPLEVCEYAISIQSDGYNSVYGSVSINEKSTPTTINALLKLAAMEQTVTPAIIVYFREIQTDVAAKLAAIQTLNNSAAAASHDATAAKNEAAQYAQNLSAAVTQAQQARTSATASASTATAAKNAAETAAGNAQATLSDTMKKSANGSDIVSAEAFRANIGLEVQTSSTDATPNRILKLSANGEGAFGLGGKGGQRTFNNEAAQVAFMNSAANGSQIFRPSTFPASAESTLLKTYGPAFLFKSADTWGAISVGHHPANSNVEQRKGVRILAGTEGGPLPVVYDLWTNQNITLAGMYADRGSLGTTDLDTLLGLEYRGTWTQGTTANAIAARHYPIISAGSLEVTYNNANGVGTVQKYTTHASNRTFVRCNYVGAGAENWSAWVELWTTANLANPLTLDTVQTIANVKFFKSGQMPLRLLAQTTGDALFIPFYDADGTTRKGWIGRGSVNVNTIQLNNDATGTSLSLLGNGDINLVTQGNGSLNWNGQQLITAGSTQTIGGAKTFTSNLNVARSSFPGLELTNTGIAAGVVGRYRFITAADANSVNIYSRTASDVTTGQTVVSIPTRTNGNVLVSGNNAVADSSGFWKTASPVINIYADGSFTATYEAEGVDVERLSEGVYKITGCHGMHSDAAWNGIDGGVSNPKCRNGLELTWNDFSVESDGSVIVRTYHRPHPDAISFARNEIDGYENSDPIDVPPGLFIQVRVNMPAQTEGKSSVSHSNVYCNSVSPT
ncbi:prophage tail fiber N-terminal domain-containing protein [Pectobacterium parvum]|uniref:Prophage tail fiber N-terminal domain-containing protein n=1 Tax=Pectobacterium parvum TaxID=2778550 RepID=A0AAP9ILD2_9GAMM|nr:prophage tail fiber N-terminal domain-containing protein [Pectobacterium parvum]QHQ25841.1 hypothetical protein GMX10_18740 [Pectobacterium parvum]